MNANASPRVKTVELPGPPNSFDRNEVHAGVVDAEAFHEMYGQYRSVSTYDDALMVFLHRKLNGARISGVNTWHEQVLAGRLSMDDIRTMTVTLLHRFKKLHEDILCYLVRDGSSAKPVHIKAAMQMAEQMLLVGLNPPAKLKEADGDEPNMLRATLSLSLHYVLTLREYDITGIRYLHDVHGVAGVPIMVLASTDRERAWELMQYVDRFMGEYTLTIPKGGMDTYHYAANRYNSEDLVALMDARVSPNRAVMYMRAQFSVDRAIDSEGVHAAIIEGSL